VSAEKRYAIVAGLVPGEWLVGDAETVGMSAQVVYSREEAFELVARAEARRLAGGEWSPYEVQPGVVRLVRTDGEWHEFRDRGEGRATVWQEAALFLAMWRDSHRGRVASTVSLPLPEAVPLPAIWAVA